MKNTGRVAYAPFSEYLTKCEPRCQSQKYFNKNIKEYIKKFQRQKFSQNMQFMCIINTFIIFMSAK